MAGLNVGVTLLSLTVLVVGTPSVGTPSSVRHVAPRASPNPPTTTTTTTTPFHTACAAALQADLGHFAQANAMGIWIAIVNETERFSVSLGTSDGGTTAVTASDILPVGSYAKPWTAVAVLRLVETGVIALEDLAEPLIGEHAARTGAARMRCVSECE